MVNYKLGVPEGPTQVYNNAGILLQEGRYLQGKEDGEWKFYSSSGELEFIGNYNQGHETGIWYRFEKGKKKVYKRY